MSTTKFDISTWLPGLPSAPYYAEGRLASPKMQPVRKYNIANDNTPPPGAKTTFLTFRVSKRLIYFILLANSLVITFMAALLIFSYQHS